jgi:hypothetical protein
VQRKRLVLWRRIVGTAPLLPLSLLGLAVIAMIGYVAYPPEYQSFVLGSLKLFAALCIIFLCIGWRQRFLDAGDAEQRYSSLEESIRDLAVAVQQKSKAAVVHSVTLSGVAAIALTGRLQSQIIPNAEKFEQWRRLRIEAADFATDVLRYLVQQQRKALNKNAERAKAIEDKTVKEYQSRFSQSAEKIANELHGYGRRGNGFSERYERLDELVKRNPPTFAEIREVATCISNILDNDGYAAAVLTLANRT